MKRTKLNYYHDTCMLLF